MTVGHGFAAGRANLLNYGVGRSCVGITGHLGVATDIVYHDIGAARGEREDIGPAKARSASGACDNCGATMQTEFGHFSPPSPFESRLDLANHCRHEGERCRLNFAPTSRCAKDLKMRANYRDCLLILWF